MTDTGWVAIGLVAIALVLAFWCYLKTVHHLWLAHERLKRIRKVQKGLNG